MPGIARDVMTPDPACCNPFTTLQDAARLMVKNDCGEIPVVDEHDHVVGVITDRDIVCRAVAEGQNPSSRRVENCMTSPAITVQEDSSLSDVLATMERHQIRRLPVVRDGGTCVGMVSQADLAREASEHDVATLVTQVSREK